MRFHTRHLAFLLFLFSTLSPAEAQSLRPENLSAGGRYVSMLFSQRAAASNAEPLTPNTASYKIQTLALPASGLTQNRTPRTMRPPSAHSVLLHAVTGSSL